MIANRYDVSFWGDRNVLELDAGDGYTTLWIYQTHRVVHFQKVNLTECKLHLNKAIFQSFSFFPY